MSRKAVIWPLVAFSILAGGSSFGQGRSQRPGQDDVRRSPSLQNQGRFDRSEHDRRGRNDWRPESPQYQPERGHRDERGAGPDHSFHRGAQLPNQYRSYRYVVEDWRGHQLTAPPRGHHWVQAGSDYVLVAIATGVILQLLLNN